EEILRRQSTIDHRVARNVWRKKTRRLAAIELRRIKRKVTRNPFTSNATIFQKCNLTGVSRRCFSGLRDMAQRYMAGSLMGTELQFRSDTGKVGYWYGTMLHPTHPLTQLLASKGLKDDGIMTWPPSSSDLNPIENLWALLKCEIYTEGRQYTSLDNIWEALVAAALRVDQ
ncbi:hypothetical protein FQN60_008829, partial [Etheostoma spectabile]